MNFKNIEMESLVEETDVDINKENENLSDGGCGGKCGSSCGKALKRSKKGNLSDEGCSGKCGSSCGNALKIFENCNLSGEGCVGNCGSSCGNALKSGGCGGSGCRNTVKSSRCSSSCGNMVPSGGCGGSFENILKCGGGCGGHGTKSGNSCAEEHSKKATFYFNKAVAV